jgi:ASC-1-like (ASCH) protein
MLVKRLSEPWFSLIYCGKKTIEIRLDKNHFHELKIHDISKELIEFKFLKFIFFFF